jgi:hypothetical protein
VIFDITTTSAPHYRTTYRREPRRALMPAARGRAVVDGGWPRRNLRVLCILARFQWLSGGMMRMLFIVMVVVGLIGFGWGTTPLTARSCKERGAIGSATNFEASTPARVMTA